MGSGEALSQRIASAYAESSGFFQILKRAEAKRGSGRKKEEALRWALPRCLPASLQYGWRMSPRPGQLVPSGLTASAHIRTAPLLDFAWLCGVDLGRLLPERSPLATAVFASRASFAGSLVRRALENVPPWLVLDALENLRLFCPSEPRAGRAGARAPGGTGSCRRARRRSREAARRASARTARGR